MAEFTKGPWDISGYDSTAVIVIVSGPDRDGRKYVDGKHQYYICHTDGGLPTSENVANAHLIASAPDLYAALERLVEVYEHDLKGQIEPIHKLFDLEMNLASQALSKAHGETDR